MFKGWCPTRDALACKLDVSESLVLHMCRAQLVQWHLAFKLMDVSTPGVHRVEGAERDEQAGRVSSEPDREGSRLLLGKGRR